MQPSVGNVYFRTLGVYGRETTDQADEDIPPANRYMNVAFVAKWLNYEAGSETTAFKQLALCVPVQADQHGDEGSGRQEPELLHHGLEART